LQFDPSGSRLRIDRGAITLVRNKGISSYHFAFEGLGLSSGYDWITWKGEKLLFIPLGYRPAIHDGRAMISIDDMTVAIGRNESKMLILRFDLRGRAEFGAIIEACKVLYIYIHI
jgi:hypothetical protein